jgi:hypothetical protein
MQSVKDFSPAEFRRAYPDTCFTCHCRLKAYRYEEHGVATCSASCADKVRTRELPLRTAEPVPWATDDEEALIT